MKKFLHKFGLFMLLGCLLFVFAGCTPELDVPPLDSEDPKDNTVDFYAYSYDYSNMNGFKEGAHVFASAEEGKAFYEQFEEKDYIEKDILEVTSKTAFLWNAEDYLQKKSTYEEHNLLLIQIKSSEELSVKRVVVNETEVFVVFGHTSSESEEGRAWSFLILCSTEDALSGIHYEFEDENPAKEHTAFLFRGIDHVYDSSSILIKTYAQLQEVIAASEKETNKEYLEKLNSYSESFFETSQLILVRSILSSVSIKLSVEVLEYHDSTAIVRMKEEIPPLQRDMMESWAALVECVKTETSRADFTVFSSSTENSISKSEMFYHVGE